MDKTKFFSVMILAVLLIGCIKSKSEVLKEEKKDMNSYSEELNDSILRQQLIDKLIQRVHPDSNYVHVHLYRDFKQKPKFQIVFDHGEFEFTNRNKIPTSSHSYAYINKYYPKKDSIHVYYKVAERDTTFYLNPSKNDKVVFLDFRGKLIVYKNKDWNKWRTD